MGGIAVCIGNYGAYANGYLIDRWAELPMEPGDLAPYADAVSQGDLSPPLADARYEISEEYVTYLCPACSKPILGTCLLMRIGGAVRSRIYADPVPCPSCGREPRPWERRHFLDARSINARLSRLLQQGCPECGRIGVRHVLVNFGGKLTLNMGNGPNQKRDSGAAV